MDRPDRSKVLLYTMYNNSNSAIERNLKILVTAYEAHAMRGM